MIRKAVVAAFLLIEKVERMMKEFQRKAMKMGKKVVMVWMAKVLEAHLLKMIGLINQTKIPPISVAAAVWMAPHAS